MKNILFQIYLLLNSIVLFSQNDLCSNAIAITPSDTCNFINGTLSGANISSAAPNCASNSQQDVWYSFVATQPTMIVSTNSTPGLNIALEIINSSCNGSTVACVNTNSTGISETYTNNNFIVGQTYYIRVLNASSNFSTATFGICVYGIPTPSNDLCLNAISITPSDTCNYVNGTLSGATISSAAPTCAINAQQDVWYSFVATQQTMIVALSSASGLNSAFEILNNDCNGSSVICVNSNGINVSENHTNNNFIIGQTYFVRVLNAGSNFPTTTFGICVYGIPTPANDLCSNAITITPSDSCNYVNGTLSGATISSAAPTCASNAQQDVWYSFVATQQTMIVALSSASGLNSAFEILNTNCNGSSVICVNSNGTNVSENYTNNNFIIGQTYYVRVLNAGSNFPTDTYSICVQNNSVLSNNENEINNRMLIAPNPVKNDLIINNFSILKEVILYDIVGKKIRIINDITNSIDVTDLNKGIYILQTTDFNDNIQLQKFVKE